LRRSGPVRIAVGKIVKPFGIKGELVVQAMTDDLGRLGRLGSAWYSRGKDAASEVRVERVRLGQRGVCIKLAGVEDRTGAEHLVGGFLYVDEAEAQQPPEGRYFIHDIVGLEVFDQNEHCIGAVTDVLKLPGHDVYVVTMGSREVMIPAVREFVKSIDVKTGTIRVHLIEGMLEEDAY
jgi:16S rRNA processing protein RimM